MRHGRNAFVSTDSVVVQQIHYRTPLGHILLLLLVAPLPNGVTERNEPGDLRRTQICTWKMALRL